MSPCHPRLAAIQLRQAYGCGRGRGHVPWPIVIGHDPSQLSRVGRQTSRRRHSWLAHVSHSHHTTATGASSLVGHGVSRWMWRAAIPLRLLERGSTLVTLARAQATRACASNLLCSLASAVVAASTHAHLATPSHRPLANRQSACSAMRLGRETQQMHRCSFLLLSRGCCLCSSHLILPRL